MAPRIFKRDDKLIARTSWSVRILSLGLSLRTVIVDPSEKVISLKSRGFWFIKRVRRIRFSEVTSMLYRYDDVDPFTRSGYVYPWIETPSFWGVYSVGLRLTDQSDVHLFRFFAGDFSLPNRRWPDWCYGWEFIPEPTGFNEHDSRAYLEVVGKLIGVPLN